MQQRLIQKAVGYAGLFQRAGQRFSVAGAGIHIVFAQGGGHLIHIHQTVQGAELGDAGIGRVGEDALGLGADLHRHAAVHQIGQGADIAVGADGHHLIAVQVGAGPEVGVLPSVHGEAAPQAIHLADFQKEILLVPADLPEHRLVAHAAAGLRGQSHIHAGGLTVFVQIVIGAVIVAADHQLGEIPGRLLLSAAGGGQQGQHQHGQRDEIFPDVHCSGASLLSGSVSASPLRRDSRRAMASSSACTLTGLAMWPSMPASSAA